MSDINKIDTGKMIEMPPIPLPEFDVWEQLGKARDRIRELEAAAIKAAVEAEREAIIQMIKNWRPSYGKRSLFADDPEVFEAIRARGKEPEQ